MTQPADLTTRATFFSLLEHAQDAATHAVLATPIDLAITDIALGIALVREQAATLLQLEASVLTPALNLSLVESLERAEFISRDLDFTDSANDGSSDLVLALCDLVREARARA